jgi:hypothetical protein
MMMNVAPRRRLSAVHRCVIAAKAGIHTPFARGRREDCAPAIRLAGTAHSAFAATTDPERDFGA